MFELPDAKRVRRSDIYSWSRSASQTPSEPDPELEAQYRARLASIYGPPPSALTEPLNLSHRDEDDPYNDSDEAEEDAEHEFEFRLFSTTAPGGTENEDAGAQKVILVDEDDEVGDGGFVVGERDRRYFFAETAVGEKKRGFEVMALSGDEVLKGTRRRAWGLEVPWRVRVIKVAGKKGGWKGEDAVVGVEEEDHDRRKKKPGKKRRIILRERKKVREKAQEQKQKEKELKEEAERAKKTRRNREKKVKRKTKEKAKKADGTLEVGDTAMETGEPEPEPSTVGTHE